MHRKMTTLRLVMDHISLWHVISILVILALAGCNLPQSASTPLPATQIVPTELVATPAEIIDTPAGDSPEQPEISATNQVFLPQVESGAESTPAEAPPEGGEPTAESTPEPAAPFTGPDTELAYLNGGNLFIAQLPSGKTQRLLTTNDLLSFAWSPDGLRLATFNGQSICFIMKDGTPTGECIELGLDGEQRQIHRQMVWSPDQRKIVLWNPINPWDEGAIGWIIVSLDGASETLKIEDPVDFGVTFTQETGPGGVTGQPVFLPDSTLVGTFTHRTLCGSAGCHYQLFQFNPSEGRFSAYMNTPETGFSEGINLTVSKDRQSLVNYGTFSTSCEEYVTLIDFYHIATQERSTYNLEQEAILGLALSPDNTFAVLARSAGCSDPNESSWATACGLSTGLEIYPMQVWNLSEDSLGDLLPGVSPDWSANGYWLAFNTCLALNAGGGWETSGEAEPAIFVRSFVDGSLLKIGEGTQPSWRP